MALNGPTSAVAFTAGSLLSVIGGAVALPHLVDGGPVPVVALGVLCLLLGIALVALGASGLLRRVDSWWLRLPLAAAMLLVLLLTGLTLGVAVAATTVPPTDVGPVTPADRGIDHEEVTFETSDGVTLSGWLMLAGGTATAADSKGTARPGPGVVLLHGAGSTRSAVLDQAEALVGRGYTVLAFDARGHGRSEGRAMDFGWHGDSDIAAAVDALRSRPGVDEERIAAVGLSMGGEQAIGAAASNPAISAVVAEGATARTAEDHQWLSDEYGWRGRLQQGIYRLTYAWTDLFTGADPPISLREAVSSPRAPPVLLVAGESVSDEVDVAEYLQQASPDRVRVWVAPGSGHTAAWADHPDEWIGRVDAFLESSLQG